MWIKAPAGCRSLNLWSDFSLPWAVGTWPSQKFLLLGVRNCWSGEKQRRAWGLGPERKTFLVFTPEEKRAQMYLFSPLPTAFIACRVWGGRDIPEAAGQYPGNCLLFPSPSPFYEGDNADIQWVPCASFGPQGPLTRGFHTVVHPLPALPQVPHTQCRGLQLLLFQADPEINYMPYFLKGLERNMCNVIPGK